MFVTRGDPPRLEVQWSPVHKNKFISWGPDIRMYEVSNIVSPENNKTSENTKGVVLSPGSVANLLATSTHHRYVKCIDIYPKPDSDMMLAIGHANGKVTLCTFGLATANNTLAGLELGPNPRLSRQCNALSWNPVNYNLLACGLDKNRADQCIQIWDVEKIPLTNVESSRKPFFEYGTGETAHSLAWFNSSPHVLVVGCNNKSIRCIDIRDSSRSTNTTQTRAVYGIDVAVYNNNHIVSFYDSSIVLWDSRHLEKPVVTLMQSKNVLKVQWCPTRHNLLGSLQKDSIAINLHDMQQTMEEAEPSALERTVHPGQGNTYLASFSWHPNHENRLLAITHTGILTDYCVFERMTLNWSITSNITWTYGQNNLKYISDKDLVYSSFEDISTVIKRRAFSQYGIKDFAENAKLVDDPIIKNVWTWLELNRKVTRTGLVPVTSDVPFPGIKTVLGLGDSESIIPKSELKHVQWIDIQGTVKTYQSSARNSALYLCDWGSDRNNSSHISAVIKKLENKNAHSRAAAIAIFNLRMRDAIETLNKGASQLNNLSMIAMALSGYSPDKYSMWRELCSKTREKLTDPYLRAAFAFLTSDSESYEGVLNENGMQLEDRIAFASIFLSDIKLTEYINTVSDKLLEQGNLTAIFLTGSSPSLVPLLQRYLDSTGDVQTVSILVLKTIPSEIVHEHQVMMTWINSYREILDQLRMWHIRAKFDISLKAIKPPKQNVFLSCNYCGKKICPDEDENEKDTEKEKKVPRGKDQTVENASTNFKFTSCPYCQNPLPRCALCLAHLGTASAKVPTRKSSVKQLTSNSSYVASGLSANSFSYWFSWCPTCNHGGHSNHISDWFKNHLECPVSDCVCRCYSLDSTSRYRSA